MLDCGPFPWQAPNRGAFRTSTRPRSLESLERRRLAARPPARRATCSAAITATRTASEQRPDRERGRARRRPRRRAGTRPLRRGASTGAARPSADGRATCPSRYSAGPPRRRRTPRRQLLGRVRDDELVADRGEDHPGDEDDVEVGVAVAGELRPVGREREAPLRDPRDVVEVEPPERCGREEREREGRRRAPRSRSSAGVVAPVMTIVSPSAMIMKSWKRSAKCAVSTSHVVGRAAGAPGSGRGRAARVVDREREQPERGTRRVRPRARPRSRRRRPRRTR